MKPLFETILDYIPAPEGDPEAPTQMLISTIDYNEYVGRIGVGKVENGTISVNQDMVVVNHHDPDKQQRVKIGKLYEFDGLNRVEVKEATIGSIVAVSGITDISIGGVLHAARLPWDIDGTNSLVLIFYKVNANFEGDPKIGEEHMDWRWCTIEEARQLANDFTLPAIEAAFAVR